MRLPVGRDGVASFSKHLLGKISFCFSFGLAFALVFALPFFLDAVPFPVAAASSAAIFSWFVFFASAVFFLRSAPADTSLPSPFSLGLTFWPWCLVCGLGRQSSVGLPVALKFLHALVECVRVVGLSDADPFVPVLFSDESPGRKVCLQQVLYVWQDVVGVLGGVCRNV